MHHRRWICAGLVLAAGFGIRATAAVPAEPQINEIRTDQTGTDDDEYFELVGEPGASLDGLTYVVIGDGSAAQGSGVVEAVVSLAGRAIAADGFFLVTETTFTLGTPDHTVGTTGLNFENTDQVTHLLVRGFTGASGNDLDTNDDGTLDTTPWTTIVDSVALVFPAGTAGVEKVYSAVTVGPDGSNVPGHVYRLPDATGAWQIGQFNPSGGDDTPGATNGSPPATPTDLTIPEIQGAAHTSPHVTTLVRTTGIVTARTGNGFYLQDATGDADTSTSDGIFVFTGGAPAVAVGDEAQVVGTVSEFTPGGASTGNLSTTEILPDTVTPLSTGNALPAAVVLGAAGRSPPTEVIDDDDFATFDPANDGIDFYESLEGMRVRIDDPVAVSPTNQFGEIWVVADAGAGATGMNGRGGITIRETDFNPERIQVQVGTSGLLPGFLPDVNVGDLLGDVTGVVSFNFGNFEVVALATFTVTAGPIGPEATALVPTADGVTVAGANMLNLDPNDADGSTDVADGQFDRLAEMIVTALASPDVVALQEIQDDNGAQNDSVVTADVTLTMLVDAIVAAGGPQYEYVDNPPADDQDGGEPGGNIRVCYLWNPARVALAAGSVVRITDPNLGDGDAFANSRKPLLAQFLFKGRRFTVINNHWSSKGGSTPLFGTTQPPVNGSLANRIAQATVVRGVVDGILAARPDANVVVVGDLNEFEWEEPLEILRGTGATALTDLAAALPVLERYSYVFEGNSQALDHLLVAQGIAGVSAYDIVHVNAEFTDGASDHDPDLARLVLPAPLDPDRDGLTSAREGVLGTNPASKDSDGDGIEDGVEAAIGTNPLSAASPAVKTDTDKDGIPDAFDAAPLVPDQDGDGMKDGWEIALNGNLADPVTMGDVDGSGGRPNAADAQLLLRIVLGQASIPAGVLAADLDVNRDGVIDRKDSTLLTYFALGRIPFLPYP